MLNVYVCYFICIYAVHFILYFITGRPFINMEAAGQILKGLQETPKSLPSWMEWVGDEGELSKYTSYKFIAYAHPLF